MNGGSEDPPQQGAPIFSFGAIQDHEQHGGRGERARVHVLIHDVERGPGHRQREQRSHHHDAAPARQRMVKHQSTQPPAGKQQQKHRQRVPGQQRPVQRNMRELHRCGNQPRIQRHVRVRSEKLRVVGIERGMQNLLDRRNVDGGVFHAGMIAVNQDGGGGQEYQQQQLPKAEVLLQTFPLPLRCERRNGHAESGGAHLARLNCSPAAAVMLRSSFLPLGLKRGRSTIPHR